MPHRRRRLDAQTVVSVSACSSAAVSLEDLLAVAALRTFTSHTPRCTPVSETLVLRSVWLPRHSSLDRCDVVSFAQRCRAGREAFGHVTDDAGFSR